LLREKINQLLLGGFVSLSIVGGFRHDCQIKQT
jgi:hypothetical protein